MTIVTGGNQYDPIETARREGQILASGLKRGPKPFVVRSGFVLIGTVFFILGALSLAVAVFSGPGAVSIYMFAANFAGGIGLLLLGGALLARNIRRT